MKTSLKKPFFILSIFSFNFVLVFLSNFHVYFMLYVAIASIAVCMSTNRYYDKSRSYFFSFISHTVSQNESRLGYYILDILIWEGVMLLAFWSTIEEVRLH